MSIGNDLLNKILKRTEEIKYEVKLPEKTYELEAKLIANELQKAGYFAKGKTVNKNGVDKCGVMIGYSKDDIVKPFFYISEMEGTIEEKAIQLMKEFRNLGNTPDINLEDTEDLLEHLYIGIQNSNINDTFLKKGTDFADIDKYVYYRKDDYSFKLTPEFVEKLELNEDGIFALAEEHTHDEICAKSLYDTLAEMIDDSFLNMPKAPTDDIYVLTNKVFYRGASSMLDEEFMTNFCEEHNWDTVIFLPSSIHEVLMMPYDETYNLDRLKEMVEDINLNEVKPEERLTDRVYVRRYI